LIHVDTHNTTRDAKPVKVVSLTFATPDKLGAKVIIAGEFPLGCSMKDAARELAKMIYDAGRRDS
jgi:hypothetical protein